MKHWSNLEGAVNCVDAHPRRGLETIGEQDGGGVAAVCGADGAVDGRQADSSETRDSVCCRFLTRDLCSLLKSLNICGYV